MIGIKKPDGTWLTDDLGNRFEFARYSEAIKWCKNGEKPARITAEQADQSIL